MRLTLAIFIFTAAMVDCAAQDAPTSGTVTNVNDKDFIEYECRPAGQNKVACAMTQVKVRRMAEPVDLAEQLAKVDARLAELRKSPLDANICKGMSDMEAVLRSGQLPAGSSAADAKKIKDMSQVERQDMAAIVGTFRGLCGNPTRDSVAAAISAEHSKNLRTCKIWLNKYEQTFERQANGNVWTSTDGPRGECGFVNISTLERPDPKWSLWNYRTRKIVTNKGGSNLLGIKCTDLDESELFFSWKLDTYYRGCDYIGFGAF